MTKWMALVAAAALAAPRQDEEKIHSNSYKGKAPPEIVSEKGEWLNSKDPVKLAALKGKVVWLEFGFLN